MKFHLSLLRHNGKRQPAAEPPRLVTVSVSTVDGFRQAMAICCTGGGTVAQLWEPVLANIREEDMTLHGFERLEDASVVQEWRLRPHMAAPWTGDRK
jgi:hypothetical protein